MPRKWSTEYEVYYQGPRMSNLVLYAKTLDLVFAEVCLKEISEKKPTGTRRVVVQVDRRILKEDTI